VGFYFYSPSLNFTRILRVVICTPVYSEVAVSLFTFQVVTTRQKEFFNFSTFIFFLWQHSGQSVCLPSSGDHKAEGSLQFFNLQFFFFFKIKYMAGFWAALTSGNSGLAMNAYGVLDIKHNIRIQSEDQRQYKGSSYLHDILCAM
jgi:hypothetical protein